MRQNLISVVIPCYKQAKYLATAISSALMQGCEDVEIIVIDDGSPDETAAVAAGFGASVVLVRQANRGLPAARNAGVRSASGSLLIFLDADDALAPGGLNAVRNIATDLGTDVMCGGWQEMDLQGTLGKLHPPPVVGNDPFSILLPYNSAPPCCWAMKREVFDAIGGFHEDDLLYGHEDWDLWLRLAGAKRVFATVNATVAQYRVSASSMSHNFKRMNLSGKEVLQRAAARHKNENRIRRQILGGLAFQRRHYLQHVLRAELLAANFSPRSLHPILSDFFVRTRDEPQLIIDFLSLLSYRATQLLIAAIGCGGTTPKK